MDNTPDLMPFLTIADTQGWDDLSKVIVLLAFVTNKGLQDELTAHAQLAADIENGDE